MIGKKRKGISDIAKLLLFITAVYFLTPLCVIPNCIVRGMCIGGLITVAILVGLELWKKDGEPPVNEPRNENSQ
ncbi:MAG: hypothetical protein JHC26_03725 [Thermofilum sp.]|uniref:hypothetical protein n=1 Tax=Thermofilum sp. TaxID=1961369 RepID=UPI00258D6602|nr:hypothetical protein [Thermofilum sp.]MCI4408177.1 hypothetical protein [Thermofilum sp.]